MKFYVGTFWKFNPKNQELTFTDGKVVTLPSRLNLCLETLIEANGHTVSYDELLLKVWGTTHRDSSTITSVISELRKAISNGRSDVKLIQTVPKKGYRFVGEVSLSEETSCNVDVIQIRPDTQPTNEKSEPLSVVNATSEQLAQQHFTKERLTIEELSAEELSTQELSIENLNVAKPALESVSAGTNQHQKLGSQAQLAQGGRVQKTPAFANQSPRNSADGATSGASVITSGKLRTFKWYISALMLSILAVFASYFGVKSIASGEKSDNSRQKYESAEVLTFERGLELEFDVSFDGEWLLYTHQNPQTRQKHIIARNLLQGTQYQMSSDPGIDHQSPNFSRDGKRLAYIKDASEACEVWIMDFNDGFVQESNKKISHCGLSGFWTTPKFSADGNKLYFSRSQALTEPFQIVRHDLTTSYERSYSAPTSEGRGDYAFSLSPDGTHMAIVRNQYWDSTNILIKNNASGDMVSLVQFPYLIEHVTWLNNDELVYKSANDQLLSHHVYNNETTVISESGLPLSFPVASDDRLFAYRGFISNANVLKLSNLDSEAISVSEIISTPYADYSPMTNRGTGVFFLSDRSGELQIWESDQDSVRKVWNSKLPSQIRNLQYSGTHQAFFGISQTSVFKLSLQTNEMSWLSHIGHEEVHNIRLSKDEKYLYFATGKDESWDLQRLHLASEQVEPLGINGFTIKDIPDGYLYTRFRVPGLWKFDAVTGEELLLIEDFESYSSVLWDVLDDHIIWGNKDTVNRYSLSTSRAYEGVKLDASIRNIHCSEKQKVCLLDVFGSGETEIIELR